MAATVTIVEINGATPNYSLVDQSTNKARFQTIDQQDQGDYPIQIPASGYAFSYWKHFCLNIQGSFTKVNNIRIFCDGDLFGQSTNLGTNGMVLIAKRDAGDHGCPTANYDQSTGSTGVNGHNMRNGANGHDYYKGETADPENFENYSASGDSILIDSTDHSGVGYSKSAVLQVIIEDDATQGEIADETFTFRYDEV